MHIYITQANEDWLRQQDTSMSGIINKLIEKERGGTPLQIAKEHFEKELDEWPTTNEKPVTKPKEAVASVSPGNVSATVRNLAKSYPPIRNEFRPVCKVHGTPLDLRGKCLQKGCKYS